MIRITIVRYWKVRRSRDYTSGRGCKYGRSYIVARVDGSGAETDVSIPFVARADESLTAVRLRKFLEREQTPPRRVAVDHTGREQIFDEYEARRPVLGDRLVQHGRKEWRYVRVAMACGALVSAGLSATFVPAARADGDPASDVLVATDVFYPYQYPLPTASRSALNRTVLRAKRRGYRIRVALIPRRLDLGSIPELWRRPQLYAHFLAQELDYVYTGRLLIVMPNGYGTYWCSAPRRYACRGDRTSVRERHALAALPYQETSGKDIAAAAATAVGRLLTLHAETD